MDLITVIVTALALGAASLQDAAAHAVKDAYIGLKALIQGAGVSLDQLEAAPNSKARRAVVEEDLARTDIAQNAEVWRKVQDVFQAIQNQAPGAGAAIGVNLEEIRAASLRISDIIATGGGVNVKRAELAGDIDISGVRAGATPSTMAAPVSAGPAPANVTKILFLSANPDQTIRLRLDAEMHAIDQALQSTPLRDRFDLKQQWAVRYGDLQGLLLRHRPHLLHFSGHGTTADEIILEDDAGNSHPVAAQALSQLFSLLKEQIRCVLLNACYSEQQAKSIAQHIDAVVGVSSAISDTASIHFAASFYQALGFGRSVKAAFDLGCSQIDLANLEEQDKPRLFALRVDPAQLFLTGEPPKV
jgi:hypothetical protein